MRMEQTQHQPVNTSLTLPDWIFLILVALAIYAVVLLGHEAYKEGMKTELTKRNGEQLAAALGLWAMVFLSVAIMGAAIIGGKRGGLFKV